MRRAILALLLALPLVAGAQQASYLDFPAAINKAGRQRMLAESIVKEYLQVAERISADGARGHLAETVWIFDDQLADLKAFASTPELKGAVEEVAQAWAELRQLATAPPGRAQAHALRDAGREVLQAAERNTAALKQLRAAPQTTAEIGTELAAVQEMWDALEKILARGRYDRAASLQVIQATDAILVRMERITSLYERLGAPWLSQRKPRSEQVVGEKQAQ